MSLYKMHLLMEKGVPQKHILYVNFEDERLDELKTEDLQLLLDAYFELYPDLTENKDLHFFLDEIHVAPGWEKFTRRLIEQEKMAIYLSGSSAKMLGVEIATSLRGRTLEKEIFPFDFQEYLVHKEVLIDVPYSSKEKSVLQHHFQRFLIQGGFPEAVSLDSRMHRELLQGYIDTVLYRDIIERYKISNTLALKKLLLHCLKNPATSISINKVHQTLKSQGIKVGKSALYEFMGYFQEAYCLFAVPVYPFSDKKSELVPKKVYPVDQGLITAYTIKPEFEQAACLETAVFGFLRRQTKEIYYYQGHSGKEVDFVTVSPIGTLSLYQVCLSLKSSDTKKREISALEEAMLALKLEQATIVTLDEEASLKVSAGNITCIPAWKLFMQQSGS